MATPYRPPASSPSRQASTECAQPSRCSSVYAEAMSPSIHPPERRGSAQAATTSSKAVSTRISNRRADLRSDLVTRSPESGSTPRSSGDHQAIPSSAPSTRHREQPAAVGGQQRARPEVGADGHEVTVAGVGRGERPR